MRRDMLKLRVSGRAQKMDAAVMIQSSELKKAKGIRSPTTERGLRCSPLRHFLWPLEVQYEGERGGL